MSKKWLAILTLILLGIVSYLVLFGNSKMYVSSRAPSNAVPSYTNSFQNGQYEVRNFNEDPLCDSYEVIEVATNKLIYGMELCEGNITEVKEDISGTVNITTQTPDGTRTFRVGRE